MKKILSLALGCALIAGSASQVVACGNKGGGGSGKTSDPTEMRIAKTLNSMLSGYSKTNPLEVDYAMTGNAPGTAGATVTNSQIESNLMTWGPGKRGMSHPAHIYGSPTGDIQDTTHWSKNGLSLKDWSYVKFNWKGAMADGTTTQVNITVDDGNSKYAPAKVNPVYFKPLSKTTEQDAAKTGTTHTGWRLMHNLNDNATPASQVGLWELDKTTILTKFQNIVLNPTWLQLANYESKGGYTLNTGTNADNLKAAIAAEITKAADNVTGDNNKAAVRNLATWVNGTAPEFTNQMYAGNPDHSGALAVGKATKVNFGPFKHDSISSPVKADVWAWTTMDVQLNNPTGPKPDSTEIRIANDLNGMFKNYNSNSNPIAVDYALAGKAKATGTTASATAATSAQVAENFMTWGPNGGANSYPAHLTDPATRDSNPSNQSNWRNNGLSVHDWSDVKFNWTGTISTTGATEMNVTVDDGQGAPITVNSIWVRPLSEADEKTANTTAFNMLHNLDPNSGNPLGLWDEVGKATGLSVQEVQFPANGSYKLGDGNYRLPNVQPASGRVIARAKGNLMGALRTNLENKDKSNKVMENYAKRICNELPSGQSDGFSSVSYSAGSGPDTEAEGHLTKGAWVKTNTAWTETRNYDASHGYAWNTLDIKLT